MKQKKNEEEEEEEISKNFTLIKFIKIVSTIVLSSLHVC